MILVDPCEKERKGPMLRARLTMVRTEHHFGPRTGRQDQIPKAPALVDR